MPSISNRKIDALKVLLPQLKIMSIYVRDERSKKSTNHFCVSLPEYLLLNTAISNTTSLVSLGYFLQVTRDLKQRIRFSYFAALYNFFLCFYFAVVCGFFMEFEWNEIWKSSSGLKLYILCEKIIVFLTYMTWSGGL